VFVCVCPECGVNREFYSAPHTHTHAHIHTHLTRNYVCGHIYQDFIITTHYYIVFYQFNNSQL